MATKVPLRITIALSFLFCLIPVLVFAKNIVVSPVDGTSLYECWIPDAELSLLLPLNVSYQYLSDTKDVKAMLLNIPQFPDTYFILFAIRDESRADADLNDMNEEETLDIINIISSVPEVVSYELMEDFHKDNAILRVVEDAPEVYTEHLVAVYDEWILDMMVERFDGVTSISEEEAALQEELLYHLLGTDERPTKQQAGVARETRTNTSTISNGMLHIPLSTQVLTLDIPDEYNVDIDMDSCEEKVFYIYKQEPSKYLRVACYLNKAGELLFSDIANQVNIKKMGEQATASLTEITGAKTDYTLINDGILGKPAIHITNEEKICESYIFYTDAYIVDASFLSFEEPISETESAALLTLLSIQQDTQQNMWLGLELAAPVL